MACLAVLDILYSTKLPKPTTGHFNIPNPSLSDPTLSYKRGLGGGLKVVWGVLGWLGVFWGGLGCFYGPVYIYIMLRHLFDNSTKMVKYWLLDQN